MKSLVYSMGLSVSACVLLVACAAQQKSKTFDLYDFRPQNSVPIDNDAYYTPPKTNSHCVNSISDSPSCGGI